MTPKEKAVELVDKYIVDGLDDRYMSCISAKKCALIAVDEILEILWHTHKNADEYKYYQKVKKEIEKL